MWVIIFLIVIIVIIFLYQSSNTTSGVRAPQAKGNGTLTQIQRDKFTSSATLYNLYFSEEFADLFLNDSPDQIVISEKMGTTTDENEEFLIRLIRSLLVIKYRIIVNRDSLQVYSHGSYKFNWVSTREELNTFSHLEILSNDITNVRDTDELPQAVPNKLIIYAIHKKPAYLFAVVHDPINEKFAMREIYNNGNSSLVQFLENDNKSTILNSIMDRTSKRVYKKS
jgi:hypothetical protein